jgi:hypothetical protein
MKAILLITVLLLTTSVTLAQTKPLVSVQGKGNTSEYASSGHATMNQHDQTIEVVSDLMHDCPGVEITLAAEKVDYTIVLNREAVPFILGSELGASQVMVLNTRLSPIFTASKSTVKVSSQRAYQAILTDWQTGGNAAVQPISTLPKNRCRHQADDHPACGKIPA